MRDCEPPNPRLQRTALRAAAEPPSRSAALERRHVDGASMNEWVILWAKAIAQWLERGLACVLTL